MLSQNRINVLHTSRRNHPPPSHLHNRQGSRRSSGRKPLACLSTLLLFILVCLYVMIGQVFLTAPNRPSTETITALDILRKEQAERKQRLARLRQEAVAEQNQNPSNHQQVGDQGKDKAEEQLEGANNLLNKIVAEDRQKNQDDQIITDDDGDPGDLEAAADGKDEALDDDSDDDDDTASDKNVVSKPLNVRGAADDDTIIKQKLIDESNQDISRNQKMQIENIRRRIDENLDAPKLPHARDHDDKKKKHMPLGEPDPRFRFRHLHAESLGEVMEQANAITQQNTTSKPRKLPKLDRLAQVRHAPLEGDPLRAETWDFHSKGKLPIKPAVPYLGTLIDAGRHYFPIDWLKKTIDRLSDMNYNLIHLRLTDDQTFNVLLRSRPQLAYPTALANPGRKVYSPDELRDLTAYAKARGIAIMPEINVPGHAGAWAGIPDMIVHCPGFICEKGYGLPLNVSHHELKPILTDVIKEIVDIFDNPPFLHLGGDEVNMADPCFREVGHSVFDYPAFELVLKEIINATGYPEDQVVRWEMTGQKDLVRAGSIEQFWESHPGVRHDAKGKFFVSTWLYFDTNTDQNAYEVYTKTIHNFNLKDGKLPTAIIAGTFELHSEFWYDRNILGRLLAVAIGASKPDIEGGRDMVEQQILKQWNEQCEQLGFGEIICDTDGQPVIATHLYHQKWREGWDVWKKDICERLTSSVPFRTYSLQGDRLMRRAVGSGNEYFWRHFPMETEIRQPSQRSLSDLPTALVSLQKHSVPNVGVILDAVSAMPSVSRLHSIIQDYVVKFGMNTVQLRLINNNAWVYQSEVHPEVAHSLIAGTDNPLYSLRDLKKLVEDAGSSGVQIIPEITTSSDAGGWINTQFLVNCPDHFCTGQGTPIDLNDEKFLPVLFSVVAELRKVFNSRFIHLGSDEREASAPCFQEAKVKPTFSAFEHKLETLMALADLSPGDIIRNDNLEGIRYPDRTGDVTQYPAGVTETREGEKAFLTVDIFDGDGYRVFQNTQKAVNANPLGVLAELRKLNESKWKQWQVPKRLLAFAMGVSELGSSWSIYDAATFGTQFTTICRELKPEEDCAPPEEFMSSIRVITESEEFIKKTCDLRTSLGEKKIAIPVKPFYEIQADGQVVASQ